MVVRDTKSNVFVPKQRTIYNRTERVCTVRKLEKRERKKNETSQRIP